MTAAEKRPSAHRRLQMRPAAPVRTARREPTSQRPRALPWRTVSTSRSRRSAGSNEEARPNEACACRKRSGSPVFPLNRSIQRARPASGPAAARTAVRRLRGPAQDNANTLVNIPLTRVSAARAPRPAAARPLSSCTARRTAGARKTNRGSVYAWTKKNDKGRNAWREGTPEAATGGRKEGAVGGRAREPLRDGEEHEPPEDEGIEREECEPPRVRDGVAFVGDPQIPAPVPVRERREWRGHERRVDRPDMRAREDREDAEEPAARER